MTFLNVKGIGGLVHDEWRSFHHARRLVSRSTIDGDLIEQFLDLSEAMMHQVVKYALDEISQSSDDCAVDSAMPTTKLTVERTIQRIEELAAMH